MGPLLAASWRATKGVPASAAPASARFSQARPVAGQFAPAGDTKHIAFNALGRQLLRRLDDFRQDGARAHQRDFYKRFSPQVPVQWTFVAIVFIATLNHITRGVRRQIGLGVVLVHQGDVIEKRPFCSTSISRTPLVDDHGHLAGERRVVGLAVGDGGGNQVAGAVLVLAGPSPPRGGAAAGGAQQKATGRAGRRRPRSGRPRAESRTML